MSGLGGRPPVLMEDFRQEVTLGNGFGYAPGGGFGDTLEKARSAYVYGHIELDEFESRIGDILGVNERQTELRRTTRAWRARSAFEVGVAI